MPTHKKGPEHTIGGRIAQARFSLAAKLGRNVTQAWLAQQVGVSGPTVSQWESGVTEPTITSLGKIAKALQADPGYLAWGNVTTEEEQPPKPKGGVVVGRLTTVVTPKRREKNPLQHKPE